MNARKKTMGKTLSIPAGVACGGLLGIGITLILCACLSQTVLSGMLPENKIGYGIMIILPVSSFSGAMVAWGMTRRKRVIVCLAAGAVYLAILLGITALFFSGKYSGIGVTVLMILCGNILAILPEFRSGKGRNHKRFRIPNG